MLIRNAGMQDGTLTDVLICGDAVRSMGHDLASGGGETVLDACGAALLPGLHDHHLHLLALATSLDSLRCGPPEVVTEEQLVRQLLERAALACAADEDWIRGIGYHESVAGDIDRGWLDRVVPSRPVRVQHRSGRLWIVNSCGLARLASAGRSAPERTSAPPGDALAEGRLYDADPWLRQRLGGRRPALRRVSVLLASHGVTGVTDASAHNSDDDYRHFVDSIARGELLQRVVVMGGAALDSAADAGSVRRGARKIYLRESALPEFDGLRATIVQSHAARRPVAVHCVTEAELVFALAALAAAGSREGDRIEHASVAPPGALALLAEHGLTVVTQPNFVRERGDTYLADVAAREQPWLYRGRGFVDAGIALAAGTDAPLGDPNPWLAMQAAVDRRTVSGRPLGEAEALSPEQALALFGGDPLAPGGGVPPIAAGTTADLCLLDRPWSVARLDLAAVRVAATVVSGRFVWQRG